LLTGIHAVEILHFASITYRRQQSVDGSDPTYNESLQGKLRAGE